MPSPERRPWEAALLGSVALLALAFQLWLPRTLPSEVSHRAAAAAVAQDAKPGDVVLLQPWWTERARLFAADGVPVVGYLGSDADSLEDASRIWVLSQPELPNAGTAAFLRAFEPGRIALGDTRRFGPLALRLYENRRRRPARFRASEALASASARVALGGAGSGEDAACAPRSTGGFDCPRGLRIEEGWHELFYVPHRCISLQPPGGDARLVLSFPNVPSGGTLVLEAGVIWEHAAKRDSGITPLNVTLLAPGAAPGDAPLAALRIPPGEEGMQRAEVPGRGGTLELSVQSDRTEHRQACVQLRVVDSRGGT